MTQDMRVACARGGKKMPKCGLELAAEMVILRSELLLF